MLDFNKVLKEISNASEKEYKKQEKTYKYKVLYPSEGTLNVRLLFNPKSGLITRLINRHNINGNKIPCIATYTSKNDCPICKAIWQAEELGITVPYKIKSKVRAVMYVQFHSANYDVGDIKKGDIILLMVPWSVYTSIQKFITDLSAYPDALDKAFGSPEYNVFTIEKGPSNTDWSARLNPVITIKSAESVDEFETMLDDIDSLYDAVNNIHETPTESDMNIINDAADQLRNMLISSQNDEVEDSIVNPNKEPESVTSMINNFNAQSDKLSENKPECYMKGYVPETSTDPTKVVQKIQCKMCQYKTECSNI